MSKEKIEYNVLTPDGITMTFDDTYKTPEEAEQACKDWAKQFEHQGYYRNNRWEKIAVEDIPNHCTLIKLRDGIRVFE